MANWLFEPNDDLLPSAMATVFGRSFALWRVVTTASLCKWLPQLFNGKILGFHLGDQSAEKVTASILLPSGIMDESAIVVGVVFRPQAGLSVAGSSV